MDLKPSQKDRKVFGYVCENFSCFICNNILIQCVSLSCGHNFCHYCLDLYLGGNPHSHSCPQCNLPISHAHPNASIDQKIDNLLSTCSEQIQQAYATALDLRFRKAVERSKLRHNQKVDPKMGNMLDEICSKIKAETSGGGGDVELEATKALKSARKKALATARNTSAARKGLSTGQKVGRKPTEEEIDMDKVNSLFGIYDHVLKKNENEPNKSMAGGDFAREQEQVLQEMENPPQINMNGMQNFQKKNQMELEELIKEADDIVKLDGHIHKWTNKMKDALKDNGTGLPDEKADKKLHSVNDQLWKASNELLERLEGIRKQGRSLQKTRDISCTIPIPTLPPKPRSAKLDLRDISDDSDAEEYEEALKKLQVCLEDKPEAEEDLNISKGGSEKESAAGNEKKPEKSEDSKASRKKSILDCVEESGNEYVKENIDFIMQMRRYKEALMKIQNHEAETAHEIRELLPKTASFPTSTSSLDLSEHRARESHTPRPMHTHSSSHLLGMRPLSRSGYTSRHQPFQLSTRLPAQVPPAPLSRPMTAAAGSFGMTPPTTTHPTQQLQRHSLASMSSKQQQSKSLRRGGTQQTSRNPLYTVR